MAGAPLRRARLEALRPPSKHRPLPRQWRVWDAAQRLEWLLDASMETAAEVMTWGPLHLLDGQQLAIWDRVRHDIWTVALKIGIENRHSAERAAALAELAKEVRRRSAPAGDGVGGDGAVTGRS